MTRRGPAVARVCAFAFACAGGLAGGNLSRPASVTEARLAGEGARPAFAAPRYDLESARERALRTTTHGGAREATRDPVTEQGLLPVPAALPTAGAALDATAFRYVRSLPPGPAGLVAVPLDAAVLAHSNGRPGADFSDLRVMDSAGRQVPYLLDRRPEPLVVPLPPATPEETPPGRWPSGTRFYKLRLPYPDLPPARLVLRTGARVFEREVRLLTGPPPDDRRRPSGPRTLVSATWRHSEPDVPAPPLTLSLPTLPTAELLLAVVDGDNSPLPLAAPELLLPSFHLRFFRPATGEIRVVYGQRALAPPRYDLALLASTVLASPAGETTLGAEREATRSASVVLRPGVFWALMLAAVVVLLVLVVRLVRGADASGRE